MCISAGKNWISDKLFFPKFFGCCFLCLNTGIVLEILYGIYLYIYIYIWESYYPVI